MAERFDHAAAAQTWIDNAVTAQAVSAEPKAEELASAYAGIAQAHATLALVEQQRITNIIALGQVRVAATDLPVFRHLVMQPSGQFDVVPVEEIREGLGL